MTQANAHVVLEANGLVQRFSGVTVVRDVNFHLHAGEVIGYLGPNGSGKSTTARILTGLLEPSAGRVLYRGASIHDDLVAYRRHLGYVPEEPYLYPFLSGREYLEFIGRLRDLPDRVLDDKIGALLALFDLSSAADQPMSAYSKGMRQKILIMAALLHDPDLLIVDEPESGLDVTATLVLHHLIRALANRGKAILYSSHRLDAVEKACSRVMVLHAGRVVANDDIRQLRALMARDSLEDVFAQLVVKDDPARIARDIVDVVADHA
jgi:ABC-2 type transport system ATP-binding protein